MKELDVLITKKAKTATVDMRDIKLSLEPSSNGRVKAQLHGQEIVMSGAAMDGLYKNFGIGKKFRNSLGGGFSDTASTMLLQQTMNKVSTRNSQITLAFDSNRTATRAVTPNSKLMAVDRLKLIGMIEHVVSESDTLIKNVAMSDDNTRATINLVGSNKIESGMSGEDISAGTSINYDQLAGTSINEYVMKLVCSNGMVGERLSGVHNLTSKSTSDDWFKVLFENANTKDMAERYFNNVAANRQVNCSVKEYLKLQEIVNKYKEDDEYIAKCIGKGSWSNLYMEKGIDVMELTSAAAANMPTPVNRLDMINLVTNLASNSTKTYISDQAKELDKVSAGKFLRAAPDAYNWNPLTPDMNWGSYGSQMIHKNQN